MRIVITVEGERGEVGGEDAARFAAVLQAAADLMLKKNADYGSAWREQGWVGNVARIMSKTARLKNMMWRNNPIDNTEEPVADTLLDLINLSVFATMNLNENNRWGGPS